MYLASLVLLAHALGAILLSLAYFRRYRLKRLPVGVINRWVVGVMLVSIVLVPYLYLALPSWGVTSLLGFVTMGLLGSLLEPILPRRGLVWLLALGLAVADVGTALIFGASSIAFHVVNHLVLIAVTVGATNLWAQGGLKPRDLALLAGAVGVRLRLYLAVTADGGFVYAPGVQPVRAHVCLARGPARGLAGAWPRRRAVGVGLPTRDGQSLWPSCNGERYRRRGRGHWQSAGPARAEPP